MIGQLSFKANSAPAPASELGRRDFLKLTGAAVGTAVLGTPEIQQVENKEQSGQTVGMLIDITRCNGCRKCEEACAESKGLPLPDINDKSVFEIRRDLTPDRWNVVNRFKTSSGDRYVKKQCMHCLQPGCATACLTKAMYKTEEGPVIWRESKCMGCRYCMISCPFDIPKFEYDSAVPRIRKCVLCADLLQQGKMPACVEGCPEEAILFGTRDTLLKAGRQRIYDHPGKYVDQIYGEHVAGGTNLLYLSPVPYKELGFRTDLDNTPMPELTKDFLYTVPIILVIWPAFLFALSRASRAAAAEKRGPE